MKKAILAALAAAPLILTAPAVQAQCIICGIIGFGIGAPSSGGQSNAMTQSLSAIPFRCLSVVEQDDFDRYRECRFASMEAELYGGGQGCADWNERRRESTGRCSNQAHIELEYSALQALITAAKEKKQNEPTN